MRLIVGSAAAAPPAGKERHPGTTWLECVASRVVALWHVFRFRMFLCPLKPCGLTVVGQTHTHTHTMLECVFDFGSDRRAPSCNGEEKKNWNPNLVRVCCTLTARLSWNIHEDSWGSVMRLTWFFSSLHNSAVMSATHRVSGQCTSQVLRSELHKCDFMVQRCAGRRQRAESGEANESVWCSSASTNQAWARYQPRSDFSFFFFLQRQENKSGNP